MGSSASVCINTMTSPRWCASLGPWRARLSRYDPVVETATMVLDSEIEGPCRPLVLSASGGGRRELEFSNGPLRVSSVPGLKFVAHIPCRHCERSEAISYECAYDFRDCFVALRAPRNDRRLD